MAGFTISEFAGKISKHGLASPNKFRVQFNGIPVLDQDRMLDFMCEQVDVAGRSVQSMMNLEYGVRREIAYNAPSYNPLNITFICTGELIEKRIEKRIEKCLKQQKKQSKVSVRFLHT